MDKFNISEYVKKIEDRLQKKTKKKQKRIIWKETEKPEKHPVTSRIVDNFLQ